MSFDVLNSLPRPAWTLDVENSAWRTLNWSTALEVLHDAMQAQDAFASRLVFEVLDFISVNALEVFSSPGFLEADADVIAKVLELPCLALREDEVLEHVIRYVTHKISAEVDVPSLWSEQETVSAKPIFAILAPRLAIMSILPVEFAKTIEPLGLFSTRSLIDKYRFDSLMVEGMSQGSLERAIVRKYFGGTARYFFPTVVSCGVPRLRGTIVCHESEHPHEVGCNMQYERLAVAGWAGRVRIDFDPRSAIDADAHFVLSGDHAGDTILADWPSIRASRFRVEVSENEVWVGFACSALVSRPAWGWKLRMQPLPDPRGDDLPWPTRSSG